VKTSYIVTFIGDDRPGLVEQLSGVIEQNSGNWHESRLSQLGGKFAGLILVSLPQERGPALEAELRALSSSGLSVRVTATSDIPATEGSRDIELSLIGPDRPGIVREVSKALAAQQINVVEMDSSVSSAAMSAELLFQASIRATIPQDADMDELQEVLDEIANTMTLEIDID
jgi:glycine cleavage system regulatory protein